ncbi:histone deacetylase complex subunit [Schizosaccharomyces cryophilus OY26]|uniref:Histone deacetylase complex subunit n=1 Tax=Schizosaccharomyces cryophilus (strain OY26 / ATCC MYA-4695 / CBS 11777 / NBRC 106824 / NRRL Y48691) TaxID=653667 RepID=S9VZL9_SCHCR|nr:histone deacetylase complex subunit [Schizosaccharomyces cryophilus OY26]EPY51265.1 histone deacetylase complex subunit [Schizosaccharomyces cryophilus OY26]
MSFTPSRSQSPVSSESDPAVGPCPFLIQVYHQFHTRNHILDVLDDVVPSIEIYGWMNMSLYELGVFIAEKILFQQEDTKHPEWMLQFRFVFHDRFKGRPSSRDMGTICLHNPKLFQGSKLLKATGMKCGDRIDVCIKPNKIRLRK